VALVGADGLRERIEVTALPLRASAEQVWSSAVRAWPSAPSTPARARAALAQFAPAPEDLVEESAALDRSEADPPETSTEVEAAPTAALPAEMRALNAEGARADDSEEPENRDQADEARPELRARVAPRKPAVASTTREEPRPREALPARDEPVTPTVLEMRRAVAEVVAAERQAKLAAKGAAAKPAAREAPASKVAARPTKAAPVAKASRAPANENKPAKQSPRSDPELERALADAEALTGHHALDALDAYRRLGRSYPREPRVLEGWSRVAASNKWWGESLKVAERWAALDGSSAAHVHLARTQKRLGQVEKAIGTLKTLLAKHPSDREATSLLQAYGGTSVALR
jgi:hypothetical protein